MMICTLRKVDDAEDSQAYHGIRRRVLFEERGRFGVYDNNHPDEFRAGKTPFLLIVADRPIGTVRVDLVAEFALSSGRTRLARNGAPEAVGRYRKMGFTTKYGMTKR